MKTVLSIYDYSGIWSKPYKDNGYDVIQIDIKHGCDILIWDYTQIENVDIVLIAQPCTDYALSGARWFREKDLDGRTAQSQKLVAKTKEILDYFKPEIWALENPMTRIHKLNPWLGSPSLKFHPYEYGDNYQKMTWLFGKFNIPVKTPAENKLGNWMHNNLGGKSERTKELRSNTSKYFAEAFFKANR